MKFKSSNQRKAVMAKLYRMQLLETKDWNASFSNKARSKKLSAGTAFVVVESIGGSDTDALIAYKGIPRTKVLKLVEQYPYFYDAKAKDIKTLKEKLKAQNAEMTGD